MSFSLNIKLSDTNHRWIPYSPFSNKLKTYDNIDTIINANLLGNAIKFTHHGEIVIKAKLIPDTLNNGDKLTLKCSISDTGIGIPEDKKALLFAAFNQVDSSTTRKYGGTGLGLSICKRLCQLMGGDIKVVDKIENGSCFEFTLAVEKSKKSTLVIPEVDISTLNILVVDDNKTNREVLCSQLVFRCCFSQIL